MISHIKAILEKDPANVAHKSQKTGKLLLFLLSAKSFYFISGIKPEIFELIDIFIVFADDFG